MIMNGKYVVELDRHYTLETVDIINEQDLLGKMHVQTLIRLNIRHVHNI